MNFKALLRAALCVTLLSGSLGAFAQGTASRVTGTVTDQSGAVVPDVTVTLTKEGTKVAFTTQTTSTGQYVFDSVQVGVYTLSVEKQGFKKFVSPGNQLNVNQPATIDVALEAGGVNDVVTVTAAAEQVQTSSSGNFGNTVEQRSLEALPIVGERGRNPLQFVSLQPGVIGNGRAGTGGNTGGNVHVHGSRDRAFNFTLDGIDINESSAGGSNFTPLRPNPDSISQFQVVTSNFTAELGRSSGAQVSLVTRSGTDEFHGTAFELYRTPALNANEYENNLNGRGKGQFVQHIFGGSLGGPVFFPSFGEGGDRLYDGRKHKTYFFTNVQLLRATQSFLVTRSVYTQQARQGLVRFFVANTACNPTTGANCFFIDGQRITQNSSLLVNSAGALRPEVPLCGGSVTSNCVATYNVPARDPLCATRPTACGLDPTTQLLINAAPLPNSFVAAGDALNTAALLFAAPQVERQYDFVVKVDHAFNERNTMYVRYAQGEQNTFGDNGNAGLRSFPDSPFNRTDTFRNPKNLAVNYRWTPTSRLTNEFVGGLNKFAFTFTNPDPVSVPFILNLPRDPFSVVPQIDNERELTTWQVADNLSFIKESHTLRGGINFRFQRHNDVRSAVAALNTNPQVNFSRVTNTPGAEFGVPTTGVNGTDRNNVLSAINDLLGRVGTISQAFVAAGDAAFAPAGTPFLYDARFNEYDFYAQDTWKVRPNLTLDYGLRWEPKMAPQGGGNSIVLRPDRPIRFGEPPTDQIKFVEGQLFDNDLNNVAPTVGFAWDPFSDGKTSVRANYRLAYDRMNSFVTSSAVFPNTPGTSLGITNTTFGTQAGELGRVRFGIPQLAPTATPAQLRQPVPFSTNSLTVFDPSTRSPKTNQWGLSVQREVGHGFVAEVNYIGRRGVGLYGAYDANQVNVFARDARFNESFLEAFNALRASPTATSPLINALLTGSPTNNAGSAQFRTLFTTELAQGSIAATALSLSQRISGGARTIVANGFSSSFFQPFPQFTGALNVIDSNDFSTYHGLETQVSRRVGRGLLMQASYTFAKSLDTRSFDPAFTIAGRTTSNLNASPAAANTPLDVRNRRLNYARSDFDRRHALQGYAVYDLPFGHGRQFLKDVPGAVNQLLGGWEVASSFILQSGRPFTVYSRIFGVSNAVLSTANCAGGCTPDMSGVVQDLGTNYIFSADERARFSDPAPGEIGNTGRNFFTGPKFFNLDMTLRKRFYFSERTNLEFRADVNNLTNTPSFEFPISSTSSIASPTFGRVRDSVNSNSRRIQLGVKFNF